MRNGLNEPREDFIGTRVGGHTFSMLARGCNFWYNGLHDEGIPPKDTTAHGEFVADDGRWSVGGDDGTDIHGWEVGDGAAGRRI